MQKVRTALGEVTYQVRVDDTWYSISETTPDFLGSLPAVLPMRAVMTGTPELMPVIHATDSQVRVSRAKTAFTHVSTPRTLPVGMTTKQVRVVIRAYPFVAAQHTVGVTLLTGASYGTTVSPAAVVTRTVPASDRANDLEKEYLFTFASAISAYKIKLTGGASSAGQGPRLPDRLNDNAPSRKKSRWIDVRRLSSLGGKRRPSLSISLTLIELKTTDPTRDAPLHGCLVLPLGFTAFCVTVVNTYQALPRRDLS